MSVGVIVGRFQTPYLHEGHTKLIDEVIKKHTNTVIFIGCNSLDANKRYPLEYQML